MSLYEQYKLDLPEFIRGRLDDDYAHEIAQAAEQDPELRAAIEEERALERVLELHQVPEPSKGFEGRFWQRFHESRTIGENSGGAGWLLKLAGPIAACVLIAIGVILFINDGEETPIDNIDRTAQEDADETETPAVEVTWDESEFDYIAGGPTEEERKRALDAELLGELKALDDAKFSPLDNMEHAEDLLVIDDFELLNELAEAENAELGND